MRFNTIKFNFLKIRNRFFVRLRNRGYKKQALKKLFGFVKFESRKNLLAISTENLDFCEIRKSEVDYSFIKNVERIFMDTFSEEITIPSQNDNIREICVIKSLV